MAMAMGVRMYVSGGGWYGTGGGGGGQGVCLDGFRPGAAVRVRGVEGELSMGREETRRICEGLGSRG